MVIIVIKQLELLKDEIVIHWFHSDSNLDELIKLIWKIKKFDILDKEMNQKRYLLKN